VAGVLLHLAVVPLPPEISGKKMVGNMFLTDSGDLKMEVQIEE
jgi:hypothetical protein